MTKDILHVSRDTLKTVKTELETMNSQWNKTPVNRPQGNWAPRVAVAVDKYLATINPHLVTTYPTKTQELSTNFSSYTERLILQDALKVETSLHSPKHPHSPKHR